MNSITYEEFLKFNPCWLKTEEGAARLKEIGARKERWTALDILALDDVSAEDKLWAVLREELIDARILHEFACWCAEDAPVSYTHLDVYKRQALYRSKSVSVELLG